MWRLSRDKGVSDSGVWSYIAWGTYSESRLIREEAEGPRKDSGVRRAGVSLLTGLASP